MDTGEVMKIREFAQNYHRITMKCFTRCVFSFDSRKLLDEEAACIDNCTSKTLVSNMRIGMGFAEGYAEKMKTAQEAQLKQQESAQATDTTITQAQV